MNLNETLAAAGLRMNEDILLKLNRYHEMLLDWNQKMDLTSVSEEDMAARHFLDSLLPLKEERLFASGSRLIDVGTGAGFPGLPLAIARPDFQVTLLEAQNKRCVFLNAVIEDLGLKNVTVINDRAENLGKTEAHREQYDLAVARAVAPLPVLCEYLLPFVKIGGRMICWKGPAVREEMEDGCAAAEKVGGKMEELLEMKMPFQESGHVLVTAEKNKKTLLQFPRKNGMPAKRPLKKDK